MSKTPERLAEDYAAATAPVIERAFLAGYKAAQEHAHAALEEAEARIVELQDTIIESQEKLNQMRLERPAFKKHEIENLLSQSNADGYKRGFEQGLIAQKCWISVKCYLPQPVNGQPALVLILQKGLGGWIHEIAYHHKLPYEWSNMLDEKIDNVHYWQELPEPPKEEE
jgi:hypothetical protein